MFELCFTPSCLSHVCKLLQSKLNLTSFSTISVLVPSITANFFNLNPDLFSNIFCSHIFSLPIGRAIVKGNNNFSVPPPGVPSNVDFMSMPPQFKPMQRNSMPPPVGNPPQHFMMGMNRGNMQPPPIRPGKLTRSSIPSLTLQV